MHLYLRKDFQVNTQYSNFIATNSYLYFRTQGLSTTDKTLNLAILRTSAGLWKSHHLLRMELALNTYILTVFLEQHRQG